MTESQKDLLKRAYELLRLADMREQEGSTDEARALTEMAAGYFKKA